MKNAVIVSGARTAVGAFGGSLKSVPVADLGAAVLKASLKKVGLRPEAGELTGKFEATAIAGQGMIDLERSYHDYDDDLQPVTVDEVIMGNVVGAGQGQNVARQAMIRAGIAKETGAYVVNKVCGSGMKAVTLAAQAICCGEAEVILAGGMENMSLIPYVMSSARWGAKMGNTEMADLLMTDGLFESFFGYHMGITAEHIAEKFGISRLEQDELGALSHQRALAAIEDGRFKDEIAPISVPGRNGESIVFDVDERPMETSVEKMGQLRPAFKKDGTVTAGNAAGINDAAAVLLLMSEEKATRMGLRPLVKIKAWSSSGLDPAYMGLGPVPAVRKLLYHHSLSMWDIDLFELNEAFAVQAIACMRELDYGPDRTNVMGSGISIGHPIGCTGARIILTLMGEMIRQGHDLGLASICIGGGQGMATILEQI